MDKISREQALRAIPGTPTVQSVKPLENGGAKIEVVRETRPIQRLLLRMPDRVTKEFELDAFGRQIVEWCDGKRSVKQILDRFLKEYRLDPHEGEKALFTFLKTLVGKGIIHMRVKQDKA